VFVYINIILFYYLSYIYIYIEKHGVSGVSGFRGLVVSGSGGLWVLWSRGLVVSGSCGLGVSWSQGFGVFGNAFDLPELTELSWASPLDLL